jgi:predicted RNase H-like HicB family nuclease
VFLAKTTQTANITYFMNESGTTGLREAVVWEKRMPRRLPGHPSQLNVILGDVTRVVHVPDVVEQDEDGVWCACAQLRPEVAAFGDGQSRDEALADLHAGLALLIEEVGIPDETTLTLDVA